MPQATTCNDFSSMVAEIEFPHGFFTEKVVIHKMSAYNIWAKNCGFAGTLFYDENCPYSQCPRACIPLSESKWVLDSLIVNTGVVLKLGAKSYLEDSYAYSFQFWSLDSIEDRQSRICIPALPNAFFDAHEFEISLQKKGKCYPPKIDYFIKEKEVGRPSYYIGAEIFNAVPKTGVLVTTFNQLVYSDLVDQIELSAIGSNQTQTLNASNSYHVDNSGNANCSPPYKVGGQLAFSLTY